MCPSDGQYFSLSSDRLFFDFPVPMCYFNDCQEESRCEDPWTRYFWLRENTDCRKLDALCLGEDLCGVEKVYGQEVIFNFLGAPGNLNVLQQIH